MIITQLEGKVSSEKLDMLKSIFNKALQDIPSAIKYSYLAQDKTDAGVWRVITVWHSREALQNYRQSVETPEGVLMFRAAGTEPTLTISEVHQSS
jgi:quinol monooxygenase YgiN